MNKEKKKLSFKKARLIIVMTASLVVLAFLLGTFVGASFRIKKDATNIKVFNEEKIKNTKPVEETEEETNEELETETETIDEQIEFFLEGIPAKYTNVKANNLTNQETLYLAFSSLGSEYYEKDIPKSVMEAEIKKIFGEVTYRDEDIHAPDDPTGKELFAEYDSDKLIYRRRKKYTYYR